MRDAVAAQFVLDEIADKEELGVDQSELSQHLVRRAQQSGQDPQEFANHMFEHNHVPELVQEIRRGKALARIVESATVTDASGNVVELKNLRPDGTIGEPEAEVDSTDDPDHTGGDEGVDAAVAPGQTSGDEPTAAARLEGAAAYAARMTEAYGSSIHLSFDESPPSSAEPAGPELADVRRYGRRLVSRFVDKARESERPQFATMLTEHLGLPADQLPVAEQQWAAYEHVNVQAALDAWLAEPGREHRVIGVAGYRHRGSLGLVDLLGASPEESRYGPRPGNVAARGAA